jgi:hypothetical protein
MSWGKYMHTWELKAGSNEKERESERDKEKKKRITYKCKERCCVKFQSGWNQVSVMKNEIYILHIMVFIQFKIKYKERHKSRSKYK